MSRRLVSIKRYLSVVPDEVHSTVLAAVFNHALRGQEVIARFDEVEGKSLRLRIDDVPCALDFRFERGRLRAARRARPDVTIAGDLSALLKLAARTQDPDTLFFTRQLTIEGETETGLHIKNLLDSLEYDMEAHLDAVLPVPVSRVAKRLSHLAERSVPDLKRRIFH